MCRFRWVESTDGEPIGFGPCRAPLPTRAPRALRAAGTTPCGATSASSAMRSGGCSSSRTARICWPMSSASGASRVRPALGLGGRPGCARGLRARARRASARRPSCARSGSISSSPTSPRRGTGCAAGAATSASSGSPRESLAEAFGRLAARGVEPAELARRARHVSLELVITAHPTEAARRTVLQAQLQLSRILEALDDPALAPRARRRLEDEVAAEITALWQADEVRSRRPRVVDEIRHALWFFETTLLDAAPDVLARLPRAAARRARARCASAPGSAATRTATPRPGPTRARVARSRAPAGAHALPRRGARPGARDRRLDAHGAGQRRADCARSSATSTSSRPSPPRSATRTSTSPTGAS